MSAAQPGSSPAGPPAGRDLHAAAYGGGLVTGDAVVVELRLAKLPSRSLGFALDFMLQIAMLVAALFLVTAFGSAIDATLAQVVVFVTVLAVLVGYPVLMEWLTHGRTLGKLALGMRVVRDDGGPERFRHALVRGLMGFVELYLFGFIAIITSLLSPEGKRVGDYLAGTIVVRERAPVAAAVLPGMLPGLAPWAATLDLSRLPDPLAMQVRQFVARSPGLTANARRHLAAQLAAELAGYVPAQRPDWMTDELFCQTVLAERRRRASMPSHVPLPPAPRPAPDRLPAASPPPAAPEASDLAPPS